MKFEMDSLIKNKTWILVDKPLGKRVVGCKWLFKIKEGVGKEEKVRLVARGFTQVPSVDFNEVFSPVVRHTSIKILLAITAKLD